MAAADDPLNRVFKVVMAGDSAVGKTTLIQRMATNRYGEHGFTVGASETTLHVKVKNRDVTLSMWDVAGQEAFRKLHVIYFRSAAAVVLVYSVNNRSSFEGLLSWLKDVEEHSPPHVKMFLAGCKTDLEDRRKVSDREAQEFALEHGMTFIETSAKTGDNVNFLFSIIAQRLEETSRLEGKHQATSTDNNLDESKAKRLPCDIL